MVQFPNLVPPYYRDNSWKFKAFLVVVLLFLPLLLIIGGTWLVLQFVRWILKTFVPPENQTPSHPAKANKKSLPLQRYLHEERRVSAGAPPTATYIFSSPKVASLTETTFSKELRFANTTILEQAEMIRKQKQDIFFVKELLENALEDKLKLKKRLEKLEREILITNAQRSYRDGSPIDPSVIRLNPTESDSASPPKP